METVLQIVAFVNAPGLQENIFVASLRWLFIMISVFFLLIIIRVSTQSETWKAMNLLTDATEFISFQSKGLRKLGKRWRKIMARLETENEAEYKLAVIESDTLLDEMLKKMRLAGETMDERLQVITPLMISNVEELTKAHEVRNTIVYDADYRLNLREARRVLEVYQKTFESLDLFR